MVCVCVISLGLHRLTLCVVFGDCDTLDGVDFVCAFVSCMFDDSADCVGCGFPIDVGELNFVLGSCSVCSMQKLPFPTINVSSFCVGLCRFVCRFVCGFLQ